MGISLAPSGLGTSAARLTTPRNTDLMRFLREVVRAGYPQRLAALADGYTPTAEPDRVRAEGKFLTDELAAFGIRREQAYIEIMCAYRQMMVPVDDRDLGLALSRTALVPMMVDDDCDQRKTEAFRAMGAPMLRGVSQPRHGLAIFDSALHPQSAYTDHMYNELSRFCSSEFVSMHRTFYHKAFIGVVLESGFTTDARDDIDTEYVRSHSGFDEYYASVLAVAYECLQFERNIAFWGATLSTWVSFLNDINDLMSSYKEVLSGEFPANSIYRKAVQHDMSLLDSYAATFNRGVTAYNRILAMGNQEQRPHLLQYLRGYVHWHLTSDRYRWTEFIALT